MSDRKLIIIAHDYCEKKSSNLSSSLNDVTIVWNFFRRSLDFDSNQIYIYGEMDVDGKMLPWKKRYNRGNPPKEITKEFDYVYYTGHGYYDGNSNSSYDDYDSKYSEDSFHIIDCCYSYLWDKPFRGFIGSTDGKKSFLSLSTRKASVFTETLFYFLSNLPSNLSDSGTYEKKKQSLDDFLDTNSFIGKGEYSSILSVK